MNGYLVGLATVFAGLGTAAVGELLSEEIRDRLDRIPHAVLRLAARRLDPVERAAVYDDEWLPELTYVLTGAEARPITRLVTGTRYAVGIFLSSRRIARHLHRCGPEQADSATGVSRDPARIVPAFASGPRNLLIALSGARPDVLARCPTERIRFQSLGWAILITCTVAMISMWFALTSAMGVSVFAAVPLAGVWGLVIMGIDRWLITSIPPDGARRLAFSLPRLVLAVLLGALISTPIVLRVFQSEINAEIPVIRQHQAASFIWAQQHSAVAQQVAYWTRSVASLEQIIVSGGAVTISPSSDPLLKSLNNERNAELSLQGQYYRQWQCQLYGGAGCVQGNGMLAQASRDSYEAASHEVAVLTGTIQARSNQLSASDAASQKIRYQDALSELPPAKKQLTIATGRRNALLDSFTASNAAEDGLLIRLQALSQLTRGSSALNAARLLLFLLFLVIECLPVTVKLLQPPGTYEAILIAVARRELRDAHRALRT